ncbi:MAG: MgtC/SapB family protein [Calditrichota bacterium]
MDDFTRIGGILPGFFLEVIFAIICGGLVGLERGLHHKAAGLRDNILICLGSVLYMNLSEFITILSDSGLNADPTRIAGQVVTGIGFIGAGVIIHGKGGVSGLTTAATIWVVAAIGLLIGSDQALLGMMVTGITLLILTALHGLEKGLLDRPKTLLLKIIVRDDTVDLRERLQQVLETYRVKTSAFRSEQIPNGYKLTIQCANEPEDVRELVGKLWTVAGVTEVEH